MIELNSKSSFKIECIVQKNRDILLELTNQLMNILHIFFNKIKMFWQKYKIFYIVFESTKSWIRWEIDVFKK